MDSAGKRIQVAAAVTMYNHLRSRKLVVFLGLALLSSAASLAAHADTSEPTRLTITVSGFRNSTGQAGVAVFRSAKGFPSDQSKAAVGKALPIRDGKVRLTIDRLPPGRYAILVLHDENANGKMDTNLLGIPVEGYGVSRDARRPFGPPVFEQAAFMVQGPQQSVGIRVKY
jgi:uncharacterized protein (DUF2141 family)